ncbi:MAG: hypothetical protein ACRYGK_02660 [Janthinobacterium lividum]
MALAVKITCIRVQPGDISSVIVAIFIFAWQFDAVMKDNTAANPTNHPDD